MVAIKYLNPTNYVLVVVGNLDKAKLKYRRRPDHEETSQGTYCDHP